MLRLYYDDRNIVRLASTKPISTNLYNFVEVDREILNPIGKRLVFNKPHNVGAVRLAVICNWDSACGVATYTKYLVDSLIPKVAEIKIFSEKTSQEKLDRGYNVSYCWRRGESMRAATQEVLDWQPTAVLIQHEYGIFPKTSYLLQMLQMLNDTPYAVTMHSVYEHLDKTVASSAMKNIICHTQAAHSCLRRLGNQNRIFVIPHGCVQLGDTTELWNTWQTEYPIIQFGFGFRYKGVEIALEALALLKKHHGSKYQKVCYSYFCSENEHIKNIIDENLRQIQKTIHRLGLEDNVVVVRGYQSDQSLNNCLRTARLAIFPYITDPKNVVYGASGAIRIAMANGIPVIASTSHLFDDMEGVLPRPENAAQLAEAIDHTFSNGAYRQSLLARQNTYIRENSWDITADRYLGALQTLTTNHGEEVIYV